MRAIDTEKAIELFLKADNHNWDDGHRELIKILDDPNCDLGTVSLIYWRARPEYYLKFNTESDVGDFHRSGWRFVLDVEKRLLSGQYSGLIRFDPSAETGLYDDESEGFVRKLPAQVYAITAGDLAAPDILAGLYGPGAMNAAAKADNVARLAELLKEGRDLNKRHRSYTPLMMAAYYDSINAIEYLLSNGVDVNAKNQDGYRALHQVKSVDAAALMLQHGAKIDLKAYHGTVTHLAAGNVWGFFQEGVLDFLIGSGAKPNVGDRVGATALHRAAASGQVENFHKLLEAGWTLKAQDKQGRNVLHYAVDFPGWNHIDDIDRSEMVEMLIQLGVSPDEEDQSGISARMLAKRNNPNYFGDKEREKILTLLGIE